MDTERLSIPMEARGFFEHAYQMQEVEEQARETYRSASEALQPAMDFAETLIDSYAERQDVESPLIHVGVTEDGHPAYVGARNLGKTRGDAAFITYAGIELDKEQYEVARNMGLGVSNIGQSLAGKSVYGVVLVEESFAEALAGYEDVHTPEDLQERRAETEQLVEDINKTVARVKYALTDENLNKLDFVKIYYSDLVDQIKEERQPSQPTD